MNSINNAEDHQAALERIAFLMDLNPADSSPEADELVYLARLVEDYEKDQRSNGPDESMDGDFDSGMASAGFGTDEDYGYFGSHDED